MATFYHFAPIGDPSRAASQLGALAAQTGLLGSLILANEGVNGTMAGEAAPVRAWLSQLRELPGFADAKHKESWHTSAPFARLKVRHKPEIVTMRAKGASPCDGVGKYVAPSDWNELISRDDVMVIDTRNAFEHAYGSFEGAIHPNTTSFVEFPNWIEESVERPSKDTAVAMFCTGGIRCERATAYLRQLGFKDVYHLQGGILQYLEDVPQDESLWQGECFVFDGRVSLDHDLAATRTQMCKRCSWPLDEDQSCPNCDSQDRTHKQ